MAGSGRRFGTPERYLPGLVHRPGGEEDRRIGGWASTVRFDASDLMPGAVGAGSFWKGMTDYFSGAADMDTVLTEIDASWPAQASQAGGTGGDDNRSRLHGASAATAIPGGALEKAYNGELPAKS